MTSIRQLTRASALALVALAVAAPAAQAMPVPRSVQSDSASQTVRPPYPYAGQEFRHPTQTAVSGLLTRHRMLIAGSPICGSGQRAGDAGRRGRSRLRRGRIRLG